MLIRSIGLHQNIKCRGKPAFSYALCGLGSTEDWLAVRPSGTFAESAKAIDQPHRGRRRGQWNVTIFRDTQ